MDTIFKLGVVLQLQDRITAGLRRIFTNGGQVVTKMKDIKTAALAVTTAVTAIGLAWTMAGSKAAQAYGEMQQPVVAAAFMSGANPAERGMLEDTAIQAGLDTKYSPTQAAQGLADLATTGKNAREQMALLAPTLDLAAGSMGQLEPAAAAIAISGTMASYKMDVEQAGDVTDRLLKITQLTNFQTRDFGAGLSTAAAYGSQFGQKLNDVLIVMGLLRNANIDASVASTSLRESLRRIATDSQAQQALAGMGVSAYDAAGKMRPLIAVVQDVVARTKDWTEAERNAAVVQAFGARGLVAFNAIASAMAKQTLPDGTQKTMEGAEAIDYLRRQMQHAGGTAKEFRDTMNATTKGISELLTGTMETLGIVIGKDFAAVFDPIKLEVIDLLNSMIVAWRGLSEPVRQFIVIAPMAIGLIGGLVLAIAALVAIMGIVNALILATPVGWITLAIVGLGLAIAAAVVWWDDISDAISNTWDWLYQGVAPIRWIADLFSFLYDVASVALAGIAGLLTIFNDHLSDVGSELWSLVTTFADAFTAIWQTVSDYAYAMGLQIGKVVDFWFKKFGDFFTWMDELSGGILGNLFDGVSMPDFDLAKLGAESRAALAASLGLTGGGQIAGQQSDDGSGGPESGASAPGAPTSKKEAERGYASARASGGGDGGKPSVQIVFNGNLYVTARDVFEADKASDIIVDEMLRGAQGAL